MKYQDLRIKFKDFSVFSLADIRKADTAFYRPRLSEWQEKGYIKKLRRGYYIFADTLLNEEFLFLIANKLYVPSYVSLEMALSYYDLIPEGVYSITSISSKKTASFKTPIAVFSYRKIKAKLLFGYRLEKQKGQGYKIADMEKAVLDYLYFNHNIVNEADFYEWRFNSKEFLAKANIKKLYKYAGTFNNKYFSKRLEKLMALMKKSK